MKHHTGLNCQIVCHIDVIGFLYNEKRETDLEEQEQSAEQQGDEMYLCRLKNVEDQHRAGYRIELPSSFTKAYGEELASAKANVCISDGEIDRANYRVTIAEGAELSIMQSRRKLRTLDPIIGTRRMLAVHLSSATSSQKEDPGLSSSEIEGAIFGTGPDSPGHDLVSQYNSCSFGALNMQAAQGLNIENGVAEVRMRKRIAGGEILGSLQDAILEATEELVGSLDQFDHIIFCMPDDALMDGSAQWTAFTYFHSHWSFFQKRRCSAMSVTIHEIGHNLGFRHSGYLSESYGDETGYMGFTVYQSGGPVKCFNGHKNWVAGWFQDRENYATPSMPNPILSRLVAFVDYENVNLDDSDVVLMRVGQYYIQYNRAKGLNIDTGMHKDKVSITYAKDHVSDSEAVAGVSEGESLRLPNYRNTGYDLIVEVCEFGTDGQKDLVSSTKQVIFGGNDSSLYAPFDYAWVSVYLENGTQESQCHLAEKLEIDTPKPTPQPVSLRPTLRPTSPPSVSPTKAPVPVPRPTFPNFNIERNVESTPKALAGAPALRKVAKKKPNALSKKAKHKLRREEPFDRRH